jgi:glycosyltransferase involved in cell wall biosynthesis
MDEVQDVVLIDPRKRIAIGNDNVVSRHLLYANALSESQTGVKRRLVIIQPTSGIATTISQPSENLVILQIDKFFTKFLLSRKYFDCIINRYSIKPILLSAGDPDISFLALKLFSLMINVRKRKPLPVYIQIHSELNLRLGTSGLLEFLKFCIASFATKSATRIRATSEMHRVQICKSFRIASDKVDPIPVPIPENSFGRKDFVFPRPESVAFVGRLHKERNPELFLNIVAGYCLSNSKATVKIIGDGPKRKEVEEIARRLPCSNQISFMGELDSRSLSNAWREIGVLISTATHESYGRSIREALLNGVPVLAVNSLGSRSLSQEAPKNWVELIEDVRDLETLNKQINRLLSLKLDDTYRNSQLDVQRKIPSLLVESWLKTATINS